LKPELPNYRQNTIVSNVLKKEYEEHNALADTKILQETCLGADIPLNMYLDHSTKTKYFVDNHKLDLLERTNLPSWKKAVNNKIISLACARKGSRSGLHWDHVVLAFKRDAAYGVNKLFKHRTQGKARVTALNRICNSVTQYIAKYCS